MKRVIILLGCAVLLVAWPAQAQLGTLNPFTIKPGTKPIPFTKDPHPFNNFHPAQPWSRWNAGPGDIIRYFEVPARTVAVPMMTVPAAESLPPAIELQEVTIPGYRVVETTRGYWHERHWALQPTSDGALYFWVVVDTYFQNR